MWLSKLTRTKRFSLVLVFLLALASIIIIEGNEAGSTDEHVPLVAPNSLFHIVPEQERIQRGDYQDEVGEPISPMPKLESRQVTIAREGAFSAMVQGTFSVDGAEEIDFQLRVGEAGLSLMLPRRPMSISLQEGWTAVPSQIDGDRDAWIRLFPPREIALVFRDDGHFIPEADIVILGRQDYRWKGKTNAEGEIRPFGLPRGPVHLLLQTPEFCASWSANFGLGDAAEPMFLDLPDLLPRKRFVFLDEQTGMPISGAHFLWGGSEVIGGSSNQQGECWVPPRSASIDVQEALAEGYLPSITSFLEDPSTITLRRMASFEFVIKTLDGSRVANAECKAFTGEVDSSIGDLKQVGECKSDVNGICQVDVPQESHLVIIATHPFFGSGSLEWIMRGNDEATYEILLRKTPLHVIVEGHVSGDYMEVQAETLLGTPAKWELETDGEILFHDALLLKNFQIQTNGGGATFRRAPDFDTLESLLRHKGLDDISGQIHLNLEPHGRVTGKTVDLNGEARPWSFFQLEAVRFNQTRQNLQLFPGFEGFVPTQLRGWVQDQSTVRIMAHSNEDGGFFIVGAPQGEYQVGFPEPHKELLAVPFGLESYQSSIFLPVPGDLIITYPKQDFLNMKIVDSESLRTIPNPVLEITYDRFQNSVFRVMRRPFTQGIIRSWVSWVAGVRMRVTAQGYEPREFNISADSPNTFGQTLSLNPVLPMTIRFPKEISPQDALDIVFFRPAGQDGFREVIGQQHVNKVLGRTLKIEAPFPGCIVSVRLISDNRGTEMESFEFEFWPGKVYEIPKKQ